MYKDFVTPATQRHGRHSRCSIQPCHRQHAFARLYWDSAKNKTARNNPYFNTDAPHPYSVFQDFNHESPLVRKFVKRNLKFLLDEYKIDGFVSTSPKASPKPHLPSHRLQLRCRPAAILKDYHSAVKAAKSDALVIFEHFCEKKNKNWRQKGIYLWRNMNNAYCQSAMGWKENSGFDGLYEHPFMGRLHGKPWRKAHGLQTNPMGKRSPQTDLPTRIRQLAANAAFFFTVPGPKMICSSANWDMISASTVTKQEQPSAKNTVHHANPSRWDYYENATQRTLWDI